MIYEEVFLENLKFNNIKVRSYPHNMRQNVTNFTPGCYPCLLQMGFKYHDEVKVPLKWKLLRRFAETKQTSWYMTDKVYHPELVQSTQADPTHKSISDASSITSGCLLDDTLRFQSILLRACLGISTYTILFKEDAFQQDHFVWLSFFQGIFFFNFHPSIEPSNTGSWSTLSSIFCDVSKAILDIKCPFMMPYPSITFPCGISVVRH